MTITARVWYSDSDDDVTKAFELPDLMGAERLFYDFVCFEWHKIEFHFYGDETVTHVVTWNEEGEPEIKERAKEV